MADLTTWSGSRSPGNLEGYMERLVNAFNPSTMGADVPGNDLGRTARAALPLDLPFFLGLQT